MLLEVFSRDLFQGALVFNIFINDIYLIIEKFSICNFIGDKIMFFLGSNWIILSNFKEFNDDRDFYVISSLIANSIVYL